MKFITLDDLKSKIKDNILADTLQIERVASTDMLDSVEDDAISLVSIYLNNKYDTEAIFGQKGTNRAKIIVNILVDIMIYELLTRLESDVMPEIREQRYQKCLNILKDIRDGKLTPVLNEKNIDYEGTSQILWDSYKPNSYDW